MLTGRKSVPISWDVMLRESFLTFAGTYRRHLAGPESKPSQKQA
jgi:hypothetical protein